MTEKGQGVKVKKCKTLGCSSARAFVVMSYRIPGMAATDEPLVDEVCIGCLNAYGRRRAIRIVGVADLKDVTLYSVTPAPEPWTVEAAGETTTPVAVADPRPLRRFSYFESIHTALRARENCDVPNGAVFLLDRSTGRWRETHFDATTFHEVDDEVGLYDRPGTFGRVRQTLDWGRRLLIELGDGQKLWVSDDDIGAVADEDEEDQSVETFAPRTDQVWDEDGRVLDRAGKSMDWRWMTATCEARDYRCCDGHPGALWASCLTRTATGGWIPPW